MAESSQISELGKVAKEGGFRMTGTRGTQIRITIETHEVVRIQALNIGDGLVATEDSVQDSGIMRLGEDTPVAHRVSTGFDTLTGMPLAGLKRFLFRFLQLGPKE